MQSHDCIPLHAGTPGSDSRRDLPTRKLADTTLMGLYLAPITEKVPTDAVSGLPQLKKDEVKNSLSVVSTE